MKYNFEHLDSFVNGRLAELPDDEQRFQMQALGLNDVIKMCNESMVQLQKKAYRVLIMKSLDGVTDMMLHCIEVYQSRWEIALKEMEKNECQCMMVDSERANIYGMIDKLFTTLAAYNEDLDGLCNNAVSFKTSKLQEPMYLLFDIINKNLAMLEKLHLHIEKVKDMVNINDQSIQKCQRF